MAATTGELSSNGGAAVPFAPAIDTRMPSQERSPMQNRASTSAGDATTAVTPEEAAANLSARDLGLMFVVLLLSICVPLAFILIAFTHGSALWQVMSVIFTAGAFGGFVNALLSDNGFYLPNRQNVGNGIVIVPGFFGNVLIGAVAGTISWGLYGTFAQTAIVTAHNAPGVSSPPSSDIDLPLSALISAFVVGIGGARWLTNEVDKKLLSAAAVKAAAGTADPEKAHSMQVATPRQAFDIASTIASPSAADSSVARSQG